MVVCVCVCVCDVCSFASVVLLALLPFSFSRIIDFDLFCDTSKCPFSLISSIATANKESVVLGEVQSKQTGKARGREGAELKCVCARVKLGGDGEHNKNRDGEEAVGVKAV